MPDKPTNTTEENVMETVEREFVAWPKIPRLNRTTLVTEKLDGTNAAIVVAPDGDVYAQSRNRLITPGDDNHGFAAWVFAHHDELREQLGEGRHFGEWWGPGVGKRYSAHMQGQPKRFSLFNALRWSTTREGEFQCIEAPLCHVVPVLGEYDAMDTGAVHMAVESLRQHGSVACPGARAEGVIVYHKQGNLSFKVTLDKDEEYKGASRVA